MSAGWAAAKKRKRAADRVLTDKYRTQWETRGSLRESGCALDATRWPSGLTFSDLKRDVVVQNYARVILRIEIIVYSPNLNEDQD